MTPFDWPIDDLAAPTLILIGDSDGTRLEHAVDMFRRLGGGVFGDLVSELPASRMWTRSVSVSMPTAIAMRPSDGAHARSRRTDQTGRCQSHR